MAATNQKNNEKPKATNKDDTANQKPMTQEEMLVDSLEKHYGVEFSKDKEKFIHDVSQAALKDSKEEQQNDPIREAKASEQLQTLRNLWSDDVGGKETARHKEIRKLLEDQKIPIGVSFPTEDTYYMQAGGKNDSGNVDQDNNAIIAAASRLVAPQYT